MNESISSCLKTNKCPGLCVMSPEGAKCLCADGLIAKNCIRSYENSTVISCAKGNHKNDLSCFHVINRIFKTFLFDFQTVFVVEKMTLVLKGKTCVMVIKTVEMDLTKIGHPVEFAVSFF